MQLAIRAHNSDLAHNSTSRDVTIVSAFGYWHVHAILWLLQRISCLWDVICLLYLGSGLAQLVQCLGYLLDGRGFEFRLGQQIYPYTKTSWPLLEPNRLQFHGHRRSFLRLKWLWGSVDHSCSSSVEVKNEWSSSLGTRIRLCDVDMYRFTFHCALYWGSQ